MKLTPGGHWGPVVGAGGLGSRGGGVADLLLAPQVAVEEVLGGRGRGAPAVGVDVGADEGLDPRVLPQGPAVLPGQPVQEPGEGVVALGADTGGLVACLSFPRCHLPRFPQEGSLACPPPAPHRPTWAAGERKKRM